jgi:hypothetical protein
MHVTTVPILCFHRRSLDHVSLLGTVTMYRVQYLVTVAARRMKRERRIFFLQETGPGEDGENKYTRSDESGGISHCGDETFGHFFAVFFGSEFLMNQHLMGSAGFELESANMASKKEKTLKVRRSKNFFIELEKYGRVKIVLLSWNRNLFKKFSAVGFMYWYVGTE